MSSIRDLVPEILQLQESPIEFQGQVVGWHVNAVGANSVLGAGASVSLDTAKRIAIAEVLERKTFRSLAMNDDGDSFLLRRFPTTCGFAAGFEEEPTRLRSLCEAIERWAWSKWIDEGFVLREFELLDLQLKNFDRYFYRCFDSVRFFKVTIETSSIDNFFPEVELVVSLGFSKGGIFPGSRVDRSDDFSISHALVESWRHLVLYKNQNENESDKFPFNRINYFGRNAQSALNQISTASKIHWPLPQVILSRRAMLPFESAFVWRSLIGDYLGWECGSESRFVY